MKKGQTGAIVAYCGHSGSFIADIWVVGNANVVRANGPVTAANINRKAKPTHHLSDFPLPGFWRPDLGVFVVPEKQVTKLKS